MIPFHDAWPGAIGCFIAAGTCLLLWSQAGQKAFFVAAAATLLLGFAALLADWLVITDREQVERLFPTLAQAAEAGDTATLLDALDPTLLPLRDDAERALREFRPEEVRITSLDVSVTGPETDRRARADMIIHARGDARSGGAGTPVSSLIDLGVDLRKVGPRFLITDFEADAARPMDRRRPE